MRDSHPDRAGDDGASDAVRINAAYEALADPERRRDVDRSRASQARSTRKRAADAAVDAERQGLVPLIDEEVIFREMRAPTVEVQDDLDMEFFLRQWANTLAFTSEDPLPVPVQTDDVDCGTRLTFIGVDGRRVVPLGELWVTAERCDPAAAPDEQEECGLDTWRIAVARRPSATPNVEYPKGAEREVLRRLRASLKARFDVDALDTGPATWEDGPAAMAAEALGRASALLTQWLPTPPTSLGIGDDDRLVARSKGYEGLYFKRGGGGGGGR